MEMIEIIFPALLAGLLIALTHALLGIRVLEKGIIFIDLAIAQIAGLGLIIANMFFSEYIWLHQIIALLFAITAALFFYYIEKISPKIQEAIIGCSFILAASLGILFLSYHPHGGEEMIHLLSGQILFVTLAEIIWYAPIYMLVMLLWFLKPNIRNNIAFYIIFSLVITISVQLVGIYVVFTSLILPAIIVRNKTNAVAIAWGYGVSSVILGIIIAIIFDLPAGILIVITYFVISILLKIIKILS